MKALIQAATRAAGRRPGSRHFLLGAAALRGDGTIVSSRNEGSAIPCPSAHAEARVLRKAGLEPDIVLVIRITRDGELALAKPCPACEAKIINARAREVWYSTKEGFRKL